MKAKLRLAAAALVGVMGAGSAAAQQKGSGSGSGSMAGSGSGSALRSSYAGFDQRQVASFSDEDLKALLEGRGMGFALPAEVNGYPGPMHVLELASELQLSDEQRGKVEAILKAMKARALVAGASYIEAEKAIDAAFRSGGATAEMIGRLVREADQRRAETRLSHLEAHIETAQVLTPDQRSRYAQLRGYGTGTTRKP